MLPPGSQPASELAFVATYAAFWLSYVPEPSTFFSWPGISGVAAAPSAYPTTQIIFDILDMCIL